MGVKRTGVQMKPAPLSYYTAERLYTMKFQDTAMTITKMDTATKAQVAADVHPILDSLYAKACMYGDPDTPFEEQPPVAQYMAIMSKIKHWETMLYWLYEIDVMMSQAELIEKAKEAELMLAREARGTAYLEPEEKTKYQEVLTKTHTGESHAADIIDLAKSLTSKYFTNAIQA